MATIDGKDKIDGAEGELTKEDQQEMCTKLQHTTTPSSLSQSSDHLLPATTGWQEKIKIDGHLSASDLDDVSRSAQILSKIPGKLDEANALFAIALSGKEKTLGPSHPDTVEVLNSMTAILRRQGKPEEATVTHIVRS